MIDKRIQLKNSLIYVFPKAITGFLPILALAVFTRILTKVDFGAFALAEIYAVFVCGIVNFGLITVYERNFFQHRTAKKSAELLYTTLLFVLVMFVISATLTYFFKGSLSRWIIRSPDYGNLLFWSFCSAVVISFIQYFLVYFKNSENARDFVFYTVGLTILNVILSLIMVVFFRVGVIGLAWGQLLAGSIILLALGFKFLKILPPIFSWLVLRDSLKISYPLTPRIFFGVISKQINKYILGIMNSVGGVGIFSIGQRIANISFIFMTALQNVFNPQVYKKMFSSQENSGKEIGRYLTPFVYFSIAMALLISLFSEEIVSLLTPAHFHGAAKVVSIFSMYYGFLFFGKITGTQLIYMKKTFITSGLTLLGIGLTVIICVPFALRFGVEGVAWATFLAGLISGVVSFIIAQHYYPIKWEYKKLSAIFAVLFLSSVLVVILMNGFFSYTARLVLKLISLMSYACLGIKLRLITRENFMILKDIVKFRRVSVCPAD